MDFLTIVFNVYTQWGFRTENVSSHWWTEYFPIAFSTSPSVSASCYQNANGPTTLYGINEEHFQSYNNVPTMWIAIGH